MIPIQNLFRKKNQLEITTGVLVDDYFSSPKQVRWSTALGKPLVANGAYIQIRDADLTYHSKRARTPSALTPSCIDSDASLIYWGTSNTLKTASLSLNDAITDISSIAVNSIRMIDASGLPNHILVTHNATDHHELLLVNKTSMAVVATLGGAASSDNGKFNNPLGAFYYNGFAYVADVDNTRIVKVAVNTVAETLTFDSNISLPTKPYDLFNDGTNWFVLMNSGTYVHKLDANFVALSPAVSVATNGYSLTLIPDQNDGNGATIAVCSNTNSNIKRHKCSDLSLIATVGSAGDGSASLFDPTFTTSINTRVTYQFDDGFSYTTASGTSHALSWNGFAGKSFQTAGSHRCVVKVEGGLGLVTGIDCNTDAITSIKKLSKLLNLTTLQGQVNNDCVFNLSEIPKATTIFLTTNVWGALSFISRSATDVRLYGGSAIYGVTGALTDLPTTLLIGYFQFNQNIIAASIAHLTAIRDLRIYSMGWDATGVNTVIDSAWAARMSYTYMTGPSLQIGGTNADPTGNFIAPVEGADWHQDGATWIPLTSLAKAYDLVNNVNSEVRPIWTITY